MLGRQCNRTVLHDSLTSCEGALPQYSLTTWHAVQVHGRSTLPSFALLEAACATSRALTDDGASQALALTDASFGTAVVHEPAAVVECQLHTRSGSIRLRSRQATPDVKGSVSTGSDSVHLACHAAAAHEAAGIPMPARRTNRSVLAALYFNLLRSLLAQPAPADACTADVCSVPLSEGTLSGGYWIHPAAAEAAAALHNLLHGGPLLHRPSCRLSRAASCGAVLCSGRQASGFRLRACTAATRRRRSGGARRQRRCVRAQRCGGQAAFQLEDLAWVPVHAAASHTQDYTTFWQRIPLPAEPLSARWALTYPKSHTGCSCLRAGLD